MKSWAFVLLAIVLQGCAAAVYPAKDEAGSSRFGVTRVSDHVQYYCPLEFAFLESLSDETLTYTPGWEPDWSQPGILPKPIVRMEAEGCSADSHDCVRLSPEGAPSFRLIVPKSRSAVGADKIGDLRVVVASLNEAQRIRSVDFLETFGDDGRRVSLLFDDKGILAMAGIGFGGPPVSCYRLSEWGFFGRKSSTLW
jgi:hypothetical protein